LNRFSFSVTGFLFLCGLFVPNILYGFYPPTDQPKVRENRLLLISERAGQVLCTLFLLTGGDFPARELSFGLLWLCASWILMALYWFCWSRYFRGAHVARDFYRPFLGIPLPLAVLPVCAAFSLSIYCRSIGLAVSTCILGIGHIGVTAQNWAVIQKSKSK
jgi:hypothetical protein